MQLIADMGIRACAVEVEHQLVTSEHRLVAIRGQRPFGVCAVEVAVGVHHFGLDPDPELHAKRSDMVDQWAQTIRVDRRRYNPVAEAGAIIAAAAEPAVVEHESFDANLGRDRGQLLQRLRVVIEVDGLPRVQEHGALSLGVRRQRADIAMKVLAGRCQPVAGVCADDSGRAVAGARLQDHFSGVQQFTHLHTAPAVSMQLGRHKVVAAPGKVHAPHLARPFRETGFAGEHERWLFVRRAA